MRRWRVRLLAALALAAAACTDIVDLHRRPVDAAITDAGPADAPLDAATIDGSTAD